jgi:hypothetical protein
MPHSEGETRPILDRPFTGLVVGEVTGGGAPVEPRPSRCGPRRLLHPVQGIRQVECRDRIPRCARFWVRPAATR